MSSIRFFNRIIGSRVYDLQMHTEKTSCTQAVTHPRSERQYVLPVARIGSGGRRGTLCSSQLSHKGTARARRSPEVLCGRFTGRQVGNLILHVEIG